MPGECFRLVRLRDTSQENHVEGGDAISASKASADACRWAGGVLAPVGLSLLHGLRPCLARCCVTLASHVPSPVEGLHQRSFAPWP